MSDTAFSQAMRRGVEAHQSGRLDDAVTSYRAALALEPHDAEALSLCGLALAQRADWQEASDLLQRAVELEPAQAGFRLNLAEGCARNGDRERALRELRTLLAAQPGHARARQRFNEVLAEELVARRDWPALHSHAEAWAQTQPNSRPALSAAARAAFELGRHIDAVQAFARVLALGPPTAADLTAYAGLCLHALDIDQADAALRKAEALDPSYPPMLSNRALLLMYLGEFEAAETSCRRCLERDPQYAPAYTTLSRLRRGKLSDDELAAVREIASQEHAHLDYRVSAAFAIAHALDARDEIDAAFAAYERAHSLALERDALESRRYDPAQLEERASRIIAASEALPAIERAPAGVPRCIFVVGMPRSGTTLVEGVLAAHSRVSACGERPAMRQILRALIQLHAAGQVPDEQLMQQWASACFRDVRARPGTDHLTDKHPLNFEAAGLIARLLPGSVIVNVRRDPVETGFSVYRQEFNKHWSFAHRLADIGHYYGYYARLTAYWERTLGERIRTVRYETLAQDFQHAAPELVRACGLPWEPACLDFQRTARPIATFSTVQVREPVASRNGRALRYAKHLLPLRAALERAGIDPETGNLPAGRAPITPGDHL